MPRILAGYLLGLLVSELLTPRGPRRARRSATLTARRAADLLPRWARTAVRLLFLPAFAAPLLMLSQPVHGLATVSSPGWTCSSALPGWPQLAQLPVLVAAAIGVAGLAVAEVTWRRLARRPRPADDLDVARPDVVRGMSARAVAGGAAALALTLTAMITQAVVIEGHVLRCPPHPGGFLIAYPWAARMASGLELTAPALLIAALVVMGVCWRRQDPRHQASASAAS